MLTRVLALATVALASAATLTACGSDPEGQATAQDGVSCSYPSAGTASKEAKAPSETAAASGTQSLTIATSAGALPITLDAAVAPCTVHSFISLASQGYFDDTSCHRLTTSGIYVLQCGDPSGTGAGGPGYSFDDELEGAEALKDGTAAKVYAAGTIAMANAGADTNGSQFFLVYQDSELPPAYAVFGTMSPEALAVVTKVADAGTADGGMDGAPKTAVQITSVAAQS